MRYVDAKELRNYKSDLHTYLLENINKYGISIKYYNASNNFSTHLLTSLILLYNTSTLFKFLQIDKLSINF